MVGYRCRWRVSAGVCTSCSYLCLRIADVQLHPTDALRADFLGYWLITRRAVSSWKALNWIEQTTEFKEGPNGFDEDCKELAADVLDQLSDLVAQ